ncbi:MAG: hypothetical protein OEO82_13550 [Gammaproteobacteria bacterium]|nr:hypothetical protein [Gammaproteobacteria bacterium]
MSKSEDRLRVVIAVTETSSVAELWRSVQQTVTGSRAEVLALFLHDERWHRAASLPFTREISRVGGATADFTAQRAEQILADTVSRLQQQMQRLAAEADIKVAFEVLPESDPARARALIDSDECKSVLIVPASLTAHPLLAELTTSDLRVLIVE